LDARAKVMLKEIEENRSKDAEAARKYAEEAQAKAQADTETAQKWIKESRTLAETLQKQVEEIRAKETETAQKWIKEARTLAEASQKRAEEARARAEEHQKRLKESLDKAKEAKSRSEAFQKSLDEAIAKAKAEGRKMTQEDLEKSLREQGIFESVYISDAPVVHVMTADGEQWRETGRQIFASSKTNSEAIKKALEEVGAKAKRDGRAMDIKELEKRLKEMGLSSDAAILVDRDKNNLLPDNATFYLLY
jgi:hypothetical protein